VATTVGPKFGSKLQHSITLVSRSSARLRPFMRNWFTPYLSLHVLINILENKAITSWFPLVDVNDRSRLMQTKGS